MNPRGLPTWTITAASELPAEARGQAVDLLRQAGHGEFDPPALLPDSLDLDLLIDHDPDGTRGAILLERMAGASANIWGPAWRGEISEARRSSLLRAALARLRETGVRILQSLRPPDMPADSLDGLGMKRVSRVWTMRRPARLPPPDGDFAPLTFAPQSGGISASFRDMLLASFTDSLDCPEWNGLRSADEVVAAHRGAAPDLERWWLVAWSQAPVGVLIMSDGETIAEKELSYVGVAPAWRGRGFLKAITRFAIRETVGAELRLLVDVRNHLAWKTYLRYGFKRDLERDLYLGRLQLDK
jgi:GNAT superfamily N-acetyltransferase